jgi:hypothetical protein
MLNEVEISFRCLVCVKYGISEMSLRVKFLISHCREMRSNLKKTATSQQTAKKYNKLTINNNKTYRSAGEEGEKKTFPIFNCS